MFLIWFKLISLPTFSLRRNYDLLIISMKYHNIPKSIIRSLLNKIVKTYYAILLTTIDIANILVAMKTKTATYCENKSKTCAESAIRAGFVPATFRKLTI